MYRSSCYTVFFTNCLDPYRTRTCLACCDSCYADKLIPIPIILIIQCFITDNMGVHSATNDQNMTLSPKHMLMLHLGVLSESFPPNYQHY